MKNWKTTVAGIIAALGPILGVIGLPTEVAAAVTTLGLFILGIFAKDNNVTGGTIKQ